MNFRKLLCVVLSLLIVMSAFSVTAFASETEQYVGNQLHFDANTTGWNNYKKIFCHIWEYGSDSFFAWQSKKEACNDKDGDGIWSYNLDAKGVVLEEGKLYAVIFSNENGLQTYNLLLDRTVIGDTAYCNGTLYENPEDSSKTAQAAFWRNQDPKVFGPELCITSIGNVVGTCVPSYVEPVDMFEDFILNKLENARIYSGKSDQDIIDDVAIALGLTIYEVIEAIDNTGYVGIEWSYADSNIGEYIPDPPKPENPYASPDQIRVEWAVENYKNTVDPDLKTNRYYFLMPNGTNGIKCTDEENYYYGGYTASWYNEYANIASIYWSGTEKLDPSNWPGYKTEKGDSVDVYYADVPDFVDSIIFNNGIIYTTEDDDESALYAAHSVNISCEYYDAGESETYPDGLNSFNNMIYVIDPNKVVLGSIAPVQICSGEWYYYYGNGCYGLEKDGTDFDCIRDDHTHNDNVYTVAGQKELCGSMWDPADPNNRMHYNAEKDLYEKVYTNVPVGVHEFYITIDGRFRDGDLDGLKNDPRSGLAEVTVDGSTVIVTYDAKADIAQSQVIAKEPTDSDNIYTVAGVKELCGSAWDPGDPNNRMHYNAEKGLYEKVYTNVPVGVHEFVITINNAFIDGESLGLQPPKFYPDKWHSFAEVTVDGSTVIVTFNPETYEAKAEVIAKEPTDSDVLGDVDGDGEVSVLDATAIQLYKAELITLPEKSLLAADTDKDGEVSVLDATQIQLYKAELIPSL